MLLLSLAASHRLPDSPVEKDTPRWFLWKTVGLLKVGVAVLRMGDVGPAQRSNSGLDVEALTRTYATAFL